MAAGQCRALLIHGTNPVYSTPDFLQFGANLQKVPFKAAWVTDMDETAMQCDLVLPLLSPLEDFGTHVAANQADGTEISIQQPLMEKLYTETRSFGDVVLDLLKKVKPESYKAFPDYYAYLKSAIINAKPAFPSQAADEEFWENTLSAGVLHRPALAAALARDGDQSGDDPAAGTERRRRQVSVQADPGREREHARWPAGQSALAAGVPGYLDHRGLGQLGGAASEHRQGAASAARAMC